MKMHAHDFIGTKHGLKRRFLYLCLNNESFPSCGARRQGQISRDSSRLEKVEEVRVVGRIEAAEQIGQFSSVLVSGNTRKQIIGVG